jgi:hypothetical protein
MPKPAANARIRDWCARFRKDKLASELVSGLRGQSDQIWRATFELLKRESAEYRNSVDDAFTEESKSHCNELLRAIVAIASGRVAALGDDPFAFVRGHAEWRARHDVPLIASPHAYRLAHRTYWKITREAVSRHARQEEALPSLTMLSDFWLELFDHVGAVLAEAHAIEAGLIVAQSTRSYVRLVDDLLRGRLDGNAEEQRLAALCGIRRGAPMAVAVARPLRPGTGKAVDLEVTLRSLSRALDQALPSASFGKLIDIRDGDVIAIVCSATETARGLWQALRRSGLPRRAASGLAACVGLSLTKGDIAELPDALDEARLALDFVGPARPLVPFSEIDLPEFLIRRADPAAFRLVPPWAFKIASSGENGAPDLSRTIHAYADCNLNVKQTARRLGIHTNTVYFRLNRIGEITGIDPRTYSGMSLLLTALRLLERHEPRAADEQPN